MTLKTTFVSFLPSFKLVSARIPASADSGEWRGGPAAEREIRALAHALIWKCIRAKMKREQAVAAVGEMVG